MLNDILFKIDYLGISFTNFHESINNLSKNPLINNQFIFYFKLSKIIKHQKNKKIYPTHLSYLKFSLLRSEMVFQTAKRDGEISSLEA